MPPGDVVTEAFCSSTATPSVPEATADAVTRGGAASPTSTAAGAVGGSASTSAFSISASSGSGVGSTTAGPAVDAVRVRAGAAGAAAEGVKKPAAALAEEAGVAGAGLASGMAKFGKMGEGNWRAFRLEPNWVVDMFCFSFQSWRVLASFALPPRAPLGDA